MRQLSAHGQFASAPRVTPEYSEPRLEDDEEWHRLGSAINGIQRVINELDGEESLSAMVDELCRHRDELDRRRECIARSYR